jgi:hypothetical protein
VLVELKNSMRNLISLFKSKGAKRAATNTAWLLIGQIVGRGSSFFAGLVCARILEVNDFGRFGMVRSTIGVFGVWDWGPQQRSMWRS